MSMRLAKSMLLRARGDYDADRAWRFLFGGFLGLALVVFVVAVYLYRILNNLETVSQARLAKVTPARLDAPALEQAVKILNGKKTEFETRLITPATIVDPSR